MMEVARSRARTGRAASLVAATAALALLPAGASSQYLEPPPPAAWALTGVTMVAADGSTTPGATLVVRGGLIEALGPGTAVPPDARVLEGDSLWVYPGMVDAHAEAEVEFPEPRDRPGGDDDITAWDPPRSASGFMPHRRVAEHLVAVGDDLSGQRSEGVVAGMVHADGGMASGQPAVLLFRADAEMPWELVMHESAGLDMSFRQGQGVYPSQLFGVIAYLRQAFMDAERYATARTAFDARPAGMTAATWDPDYESLRMAMAGNATVWFRADSDEDIRRVLNLADEFGFRPAIVGGEEAWKHAEELARRNVPVLVSLDFPEPDEWDPDDEEQGALDPDAEREKSEIEAAWANPGRLEAAGVTFVLTSGGGAADILEGVRVAVENGLSEAAALRAVTTGPAGLLDIASVTRVAQGGSATFMVLNGPMLDDESGVVYTFVEGQLEEGRALGSGGGGTGDAPATSVSGSWEGTISAQGMNIGFVMNLTMAEDGSLGGTLTADGQGESQVRGSVSGSSMTVILEAEGMPEPIEMDGTLSEDGSTFTGSASSFMGDFDFRATKNPGAEWTWADLFGGSGSTTDGKNQGGGR